MDLWSRMFGVIVRRSLSLQRGAFTDLVFFLVLILSCRGQELIGPSQPIVALVGENVTLPCHLEPFSDAFDLTVEWARPDLDPRYIFVRRNGEEAEYKTNLVYRGRTGMFPDELKHGNVSLKLSKVQLSDEAEYRCFIPSLSKSVTLQLLVGCVSSPVLQVTQTTDGVMLECESKGLYPEPEVFWFDAEGNLLSALSETLRGPDGLYTVSSRLTVERKHGNKLTCRVTQREINQSRENQTTVPDHFFVVQTTTNTHVVISAVIGCAALVLIPAVIFVLWKWKQNRLNGKMTPERDLSQFHVEKEGEEERKALIAEREEENNEDNKGEEEEVQSQSEAEVQNRSLSESGNNMSNTTTGGGEIKERETEGEGETNLKQDVVQGPVRPDGAGQKQTEKLSESNSGPPTGLETGEQGELTQNQEVREKTELKEQQETAERKNEELPGENEVQTVRGQKERPVRGQEEKLSEDNSRPPTGLETREQGELNENFLRGRDRQKGEEKPQRMERRKEEEETEISQQEEKHVRGQEKKPQREPQREQEDQTEEKKQKQKFKMERPRQRFEYYPPIPPKPAVKNEKILNQSRGGEEKKTKEQEEVKGRGQEEKPVRGQEEKLSEDNSRPPKGLETREQGELNENFLRGRDRQKGEEKPQRMERRKEEEETEISQQEEKHVRGQEKKPQREPQREQEDQTEEEKQKQKFKMERPRQRFEYYPPIPPKPAVKNEKIVNQSRGEEEKKTKEQEEVKGRGQEEKPVRGQEEKLSEDNSRPPTGLETREQGELNENFLRGRDGQKGEEKPQRMERRKEEEETEISQQEEKHVRGQEKKPQREPQREQEDQTEEKKQKQKFKMERPRQRFEYYPPIPPKPAVKNEKILNQSRGGEEKKTKEQEEVKGRGQEEKPVRGQEEKLSEDNSRPPKGLETREQGELNENFLRGRDRQKGEEKPQRMERRKEEEETEISQQEEKHVRGQEKKPQREPQREQEDQTEEEKQKQKFKMERPRQRFEYYPPIPPKPAVKNEKIVNQSRGEEEKKTKEQEEVKGRDREQLTDSMKRNQ